MTNSCFSISIPIKSKFHENKDWNTIIHQPPDCTFCSSRASSTKTRIETHNTADPHIITGHIKSKFHENKDWNRWTGRRAAWACTSRASSTKTRIETSLPAHRRPPQTSHQEQVPRKQGLKPVALLVFRIWTSKHQEQVPRKQGLKHLRFIQECKTLHIHQEQVPRKQGLKHRS